MINIYRYRLPFHSPFKIAGTTFDVREGVLLRYTAGNMDLVSEAAPLPGFSLETSGEVHALLKREKQGLRQFLDKISNPEQLKNFLRQKQFPPSVSFCISCLGLDLITGRNPELQTPLAGPIRHHQVRVNGVIGAGPVKQVIHEVRKQYNSGFRTVKIKCRPDPEGLPGAIQSLSRQYPDLQFRLDANRSWEADQVPGILEKFKGLPIEYCEEPCHFRDLEQISYLNNISPVPLALDESIENISHLRKIIESAAVNIVIIKPMLLGSVLDLIETFAALDTPIIERVCTTSLESGIGRASIARLASVIGSGHLAHGLSTGSLLKDDLTITTPILQNGSIELDSTMPWCMEYANCHADRFLKG